MRRLGRRVARRLDLPGRLQRPARRRGRTVALHVARPLRTQHCPTRGVAGVQRSGDSLGDREDRSGHQLLSPSGDGDERTHARSSVEGRGRPPTDQDPLHARNGRGGHHPLNRAKRDKGAQRPHVRTGILPNPGIVANVSNRPDQCRCGDVAGDGRATSRHRRELADPGGRRGRRSGRRDRLSASLALRAPAQCAVAHVEGWTTRRQVSRRQRTLPRSTDAACWSRRRGCDAEVRQSRSRSRQEDRRTAVVTTIGPPGVPMIRVVARRSNDVSYFTNDAALELDGLRDGRAGWWLRGRGDTTDLRDVASVLGTTERSAVQGYDIIVAAPRPISILIAVDPEHGAGVVAAHRESVNAAVTYLEEHSLVVRDRRNGGDRDETGRWRSIVSFTHGVNRHGEPHLHDHVLVGAQPEHSRTVLDSRGLFAHALAADALYRTSLRHELAERTPWTAWRSFNGIEHVAGLDEGYRALWGGHHAERGEKLHWERRDARETWSADQERFTPEAVLDAPTRHRATLDEHGFA